MDKLSLQRSNELTLIAQDFFEFKVDYLNNCNNRYLKTQNNKRKILSLLNGQESDWNNWRWQQENKIHSADLLEKLFNIDVQMKENINNTSQKYRWNITPYYLSQILTENYSDPIFAQSVPSILETEPWGTADPMKESSSNPAGAITRRYPDRIIINVTNNCFMFCRHCQRRRNIGQCDRVIAKPVWQESVDYLYEHPEIRDVLITGGDPFTMSDEQIDNLVTDIRAIPSVEIIRIGTRAPVTLPQRITPQLLAVIRKHAPVYINTQFNHPNEVTAEAKEACLKLVQNGAVLGNQMVFLKGINDSSNIVRMLNQQLLTCGVRPYYIFHPKKVIGTKHFYIPLIKGAQIVESLYGHTSGLAIPSYIYNSDAGLGKIRINKDIFLNKSSGYIKLSTWEGKSIEVKID